MMNNGRPLTKKQTIRVLLATTILIWATQTLLKQWGFGAEIPSTQPMAAVESPERFVPVGALRPAGAMLEIRGDASVIGSEVRLRQICRWSDQDKGLFEPIGDLILARLSSGAPFKALSVDEIRSTLRDAGVNIAAINFTGSINCTVSRSDVQYDEKDGLAKWIEVNTPTTAPAAAPELASAVTPATHPDDASPVRTLRDLLVNDLAVQLNLPVDILQVDFRQQDLHLLNTSTPLFSFDIQPIRNRSLGAVSWNVTVSAGDGQQRRKVTISAQARAWQDQVVIMRPLTSRQIIRTEDLVKRRALVDQTTDDTLLAMDQIVGQQASRDLKPGTILTSKMIDPVTLVKVGQFVTITLDQGSVSIKTVARALEGGVYGQTIRVKNESTRDVYQVILTGPQTATMNLSTPIAPVASVGTQN